MGNRITFIKIIFALMSVSLTILFFIQVTITASAKVGPDNDTVLPQIKQDVTNRNELRAFFDEIIPYQLRQYHVPGAVVSVVKDGELFFADGYGFADIENSTPVIANRTLFRIGSISKLFTWTAVLQLVEKGKLDLNISVNNYLEVFKIPDTYDKPITLTHLMTHTPGFESRRINTKVSKAEELVPLGDLLATNLPKRVRPPGQMTAYSNHGSALAGYIVEHVSKQSFNEYVHKNIFEPLGMLNSTFDQPIPSSLSGKISTGYKYSFGSFKAQDFQYINLAPAGSMSSTATDMARFMIAHLQKGYYRGSRILQPDTTENMHLQHFTSDSRINGMTYGFFEILMNDHRLIGHTGATNGFRTLTVLCPEQSIGLFAAYNCGSAGPALEHLLQSFFDTFYPIENEPAYREIPQSHHQVTEVTGYYRSSISSFTTFEKLFSEIISINENEDFSIKVKQVDIGNNGKSYLEVEPYLFKEIDGQNVMVFHNNGDSRTNLMFQSATPHKTFIRLQWYESPPFHLVILIASILAFFLIPYRFFCSILKHRRKNGKHLESGPLRLVNLLILIGCVINLVSLFLLLVVSLDLQAIEYGIPPIVFLLMTFFIISGFLTLGSGLLVILLWIIRSGSISERLRNTSVTFVMFVFIWQVNYFNLLGFHF